MKNFTRNLSILVFFTGLFILSLKICIDKKLEDCIWIIALVASLVMCFVWYFYLIALQKKISDVLNNTNSDAVKIDELIKFIASDEIDLGTKLALVTNFYSFDSRFTSYIQLCDALFEKYDKSFTEEKSIAKKEEIKKEYYYLTNRLKSLWCKTHRSDCEGDVEKFSSEDLKKGSMIEINCYRTALHCSKYYESKLVATQMTRVLNSLGQDHNSISNITSKLFYDDYSNRAENQLPLNHSNAMVIISDLFMLCDKN